MSKKKTTRCHTYVVLVDWHNRYKHNTAGRYLVGANSEKEAKDMLQKAIGFGSVQVYYCATDDGYRLTNSCDALMSYGQMQKVDFVNSGKGHIENRLMPVLHANACRKLTDRALD